MLRLLFTTRRRNAASATAAATATTTTAATTRRTAAARHIRRHEALARAAIEHGLHVFPGVSHLLRGATAQPHVAAPRIEVGRVRLHVLVAGRHSVRVEDELVGREKQAAVRALDAFGARRVVARRQETAAAAPRTFVVHAEGEVFGQPRRRIVAEKRLAQALRLAPSDHAAATRADRHGAGAPQDFQLDGRALDAGDAERHAPVVDLVVGELLQQCIGDLGETEALLAFDEQ